MEIVELSSRTRGETLPESRLQRLTVADGLLALVLVLAGVMRFVGLGQLPLATAEAELAWAVWRFWQPGSEALALSSPAYFTFTALLTPILGYGDAVMRLAPALFGLGLVCLPWLLRQRLGNVGALAASVFLAVSPLNAAVSRAAGGEVFALFAVLLLFVSLLRHQESYHVNWLYVGLAALGLGLASGPLFYSGLVTLAAAWFVQSRLGLGLSIRPFKQEGKEVWRTAVLIGVAVFVAGSSFFLWHPGGLGGAAQILGAWLGQMGGGGLQSGALQSGSLQIGRTLADPFMALGRYEPGLLVLGSVAVVWALWRGHALGLTLVYWLLAGLLMMLVQPGVMSNVPLLTLPGYLLIGLFGAFVWQKRATAVVVWSTAAVVFLLLILIVVNVGRFSRVVAYDPGNIQYFFMIIVGVILMGVLLYGLLLMDVTAVGQGVLLALLAFFVFVAWGTGWWLAHHAANDPRERWVLAGTDTDIHLLVGSLRSLSRQFNNSDTGLDIASSVDTPVIRWYLRDFENARIGQTLPAAAANAVLITPMQSEPALGQSYSGQDFGLTVRQAAPFPAVSRLNSAVETLRWWFFHDSAAPLDKERVIMWVRADLMQR